MGLGYSTLNRYDPRTVAGLSDTALYYQLVVGGPQSVNRDYMGRRLLVPIVAKPFYWFARSHLKAWEPVFFGLLVANAIFSATSVCVLVSIGYRVGAAGGIPLFAGALYLLNFAVANLQLNGLIDSGEACFMLMVTWTLLHRRWRWLPLWGVLGTLAKETFVPLALVFTAVWWLVERRQPVARVSAAWVLALGAASVITLVLLHSMLAGYLIWPGNVASQAHARGNVLAALWRVISHHGFWYVFGWLLPLGVWRLSRLPRAWVGASIAAGGVALLMGAWKDMLGTAARPLFDVLGPILSLSAAIFLSQCFPQTGYNERVAAGREALR